MYDLIYYLFAVEAAPASTANGAVIIWAVLILVSVVGVLFKLLTSQQDKSELRCVTENEKLKKRIDELQDTINQIYKDQTKDSTAALVGVATALDGLKQAVVQIGSGSGGYRKQP